MNTNELNAPNASELSAPATFWRQDTIAMDSGAYDRTISRLPVPVTEYTVPTGFCPAALEMMNYLEGTAFIFEYGDVLIMTDESLDLTIAGDGTPQDPYGGPRGVFETWDEMEAFLAETWKEIDPDEE